MLELLDFYWVTLWGLLSFSQEKWPISYLSPILLWLWQIMLLSGPLFPFLWTEIWRALQPRLSPFEHSSSSWRLCQVHPASFFFFFSRPASWTPFLCSHRTLCGTLHGVGAEKTATKGYFVWLFFSHRSWFFSLTLFWVLCSTSNPFLSHSTYKIRKNKRQDIDLANAFK